MRSCVNPYRGEPPTGEPDAGEPHVRFGGRGSHISPYPYQVATVASAGPKATCVERYVWRNLRRKLSAVATAPGSVIHFDVE